MDEYEVISNLVDFPAGYALVEEEEQMRNGVMVRILRYQDKGIYQLNGPRIIAVFDEDQMVSLKNLTEIPTGELLDDSEAVERAEQLLEEANYEYGADLVYLQTEYQERSFLNEDGDEEDFPVLWIKFTSGSGNYSWATLGGSGEVIELEYESEWDFLRGRRKTEMWDNDDWVQAYYGQGPQLPSPQALA